MILEFLTSFISYWWQKLIATLLLLLPLCFTDLIKNETQIILLIIFAFLLDLFLGSILAIKNKNFSSEMAAKRSCVKITLYGIAMINVGILASSNLIFNWTFNALGLYILFSEVLSNFEKLSLLGFKIPTKLLAKINENYEKLYLADDNKKKKIKEKIINKRNHE